MGFMSKFNHIGTSISRFAHLINVEYFDSLFAAFNSLIESGVRKKC